MTESSPTQAEPNAKDPKAAPPKSDADVLYVGDDSEVEVPPVLIYEAEAIYEQVEIVPEYGWRKRWWISICSACHWLFGVFSLIIGLAVLATFPILQLLSLG